MKYQLITVLILLTALGFYALGSGEAGSLFLIAGVLHEACFWVRLRRRFRAGR